MSDSLQPHGLQHTRLPCPSPSPRVCSNSCPLSRWCYLTISSSATLFFFAFNLFQHQGLFQWVGFSHQVAKKLQLQFHWWLPSNVLNFWKPRARIQAIQLLTNLKSYLLCWWLKFFSDGLTMNPCLPWTGPVCKYCCGVVTASAPLSGSEGSWFGWKIVGSAFYSSLCLFPWWALL